MSSITWAARHLDRTPRLAESSLRIAAIAFSAVTSMGRGPLTYTNRTDSRVPRPERSIHALTDAYSTLFFPALLRFGPGLESTPP
jgi:hypothetical protein